MGAGSGFVPLPDEGTGAYSVFEMRGERGMACRGEAPGPYAAARVYSAEPWCPGHCARYAALTLWGKEG